MGWTAIKNGELLRLASELFEVFVTVDRNLAFQQPMDSLRISVIVLRANSNRLADLMPLVPALHAAVAATTGGTVSVIGN